jgi:DNA-binding NarL/FixJ family response regulator
MTGRTIRLAIQSSRRLVREALGAYLASGPGFAVVGQTASLDSLMALCALRRPEVALIEIDSLTGEVVEALRHFRMSCPGTEAVIAYATPAPHAVDTALRLGITALVPSSQGIDAVVRMLQQRAGPAVRQHRNGTALTDREMEIISLMGSGYGVPEMADLLDISRRTVENHKRRIYSKLHVGNQSHAVSRATVLGLLDAPAADPERPSGFVGGETSLVVVRGASGRCRDQVVLALVAGGQPFTFADTPPVTGVPANREKANGERANGDKANGDKLAGAAGLTRWQRDALASVLIDPVAEDWTVAGMLGGPVIVVLSKRPDLAALVDALLRGARGLVHIDDVRDDLCSVLSLVRRGYFAFNAVDVGELADWLGDSLADNGAGLPEPGPPELTARERDILSSIANGHTIRQTARVLGIACKTVENTQARLFRKLGAHNRSGALRTAYRLGLVDPATSEAGPPATG